MSIEAKSLGYWKLCDDLAVVDAALLIAGYNPSDYQNVLIMDASDQPDNFNAVFVALTSAIKLDKLKANRLYTAYDAGTISWEYIVAMDERIEKYTENFYVKRTSEESTVSDKNLPNSIIYYVDPDWIRTTVNVDDLKQWLKSKGYNNSFFFPEENCSNLPDYLNKQYPYYSPKLAAAIHAWEAIIKEPNLTISKTPKQAMEGWLSEHASDYDLMGNDSRPNDTGIEEISKVANWKKGGGTPKIGKTNLE